MINFKEQQSHDHRQSSIDSDNSQLHLYSCSDLTRNFKSLDAILAVSTNHTNVTVSLIETDRHTVHT